MAGREPGATLTLTMSDGTAARTIIVITGGLGNLGSKLCRHLLDRKTVSGGPPTPKKYEVVLVEHPAFIDPSKPPPPDGAAVLPCDLGNPSLEQRRALREVLGAADALVHFSAVNPYPNASWGESARSMDHTFFVFQMAVICKVRRVILASSNHVMGGYKDDPSYGPSSVLPTTAPRVGTLPLNPALIESSGDAVAYGAAKLAGERLAMALGDLHGETTTFVALRIGWCQPGENRPGTLSAAGSPPEFLKEGGLAPEPSEEDERDELWYKRMWLSNRDFLDYFDGAIHLDVAAGEEQPKEGDDRASIANPHRNVRRGFVLLNAMSRNDGAKWNLDETERLLGVVSRDDALA